MNRVDTKTALTTYVRARLLSEEREAGRGFRQKVAKQTGLSPAHVSNLMNREEIGVGVDAIDAFAKFWNMSSPDQLVLEANNWAKEHAPAARASKLPNLEAAIEIAQGRSGPLPAKVVEEARALAQNGRDFSVAAWSILLGELAVMVAAETAREAPPKRPRR